MSVDEARKYAADITSEAKHAIACFDDPEILKDLADYLLVREK